MKALALILLIALALIIAFLVLLRLKRFVRPAPFPWQLTWILESPMRKIFFSPRKTLDWTGLERGMRALELGPGPGYLTPEASRRLGNEGRLYCLDIQPQMLVKIKRKLQRHSTNNVALVAGEASSLPFKDRSLDMAFLVFVLGEVPRPDQALAELHRVLKPGGVLSVAEVLPDPDYSLKSTTIGRVKQAGFTPFQEHGNFFYYAVNFQKQ